MQPMGYATLDAASPALPYGAHPSLPAGRGEHEYVGSLGGLQSLLEWHPIERKTARSAAQAKSRFRMESRTAACGPSRVVGVSCGTRGSVAELSSDFDVAGRRGGQVILAPFAEEDGASSRPRVTHPSKRYAPDGIADLRDQFQTHPQISPRSNVTVRSEVCRKRSMDEAAARQLLFAERRGRMVGSGAGVCASPSRRSRSAATILRVAPPDPQACAAWRSPCRGYETRCARTSRCAG